MENHKKRIISVTLALLFVLAFTHIEHLKAQESRAPGAIYTVNTTDDLISGSCNATHCSLREAIIAANGNAGTDTIQFNFNSAMAILPTSPLPDISGPTIIDGTTGNGSSCPTTDTPANLHVVLSGFNYSSPGGPLEGALHLASGSDGSVIQGIQIVNWDDEAGIIIDSQNNHIRCNQIGFSGLIALPNDRGISVRNSNNTIGGTLAAHRNVISGNIGMGITIALDSDNNELYANFIGTTADRKESLPNGGGIFLSSEVDGTVIGSSIWPNIIAYNGGDGIRHQDLNAPFGSGNSFRYNLIYDNAELGINLVPNAGEVVGSSKVTPNDAADSDSGPNGLQNFPILTIAENTGRIQGTFSGPTNQNFTIDVYQNDSCDPSGHGEGEDHLTSFVLTTAPSGIITSIDQILTPKPTLGKYLSLTATASNGSSSEFGNCVAVTEKTFIVNSVSGSADDDPGDGACEIAGGGSACTLRAAVQEVNALDNGRYKIRFDLPAGSVIQPTASSFIPTITTPVDIDAVTGNGSASCPDNLFVTLQGNLQGGAVVDGLVLGAGSNGSTIRGLAITRFSLGDAIQVDSANNTIVCNNLGVEADGVTGNANEIGLRVLGDNNTIGGATAVDRNVVSANSSVGMYFQVSAENNHIYGNYIGADATGDAGLGNNAAGIQIDGFFNNVGSAVNGTGNVISANNGNGIFLRNTGGKNYIAGNIIGLNKNGTFGAIPIPGNGSEGIYVGSNTNIIGGDSVAARNLISNNGSHGILVFAADNTTISANYIGTDGSGYLPVGNALAGVRVEQGDGTIIGGDTAVEGNLISANLRTGIFLFDNVNDTTIKNNRIGVDPLGEGLGNGYFGVHMDTNTSQTLVDNNIIGWNGRDGIRVDNSSVSNRFTRNSIYNNGWLGIDLGEDGVTPNDPAPDSDSGANGLQNYPVIDLVDPVTSNVTYHLESKPNTSYSIEFYRSDSCDDSGFGQGVELIYTRAMASDAGGNIAETLNFGGYNGGDALTAIATAGGQTSEFSQCYVVCDIPGAVDPTISIMGDDVQLDWTAVPAATYFIYRGINSPYSQSIYDSSFSSTWTDLDTNEIGDVNENHYYHVIAETGCGPGTQGKTVGEFDFAIAPGQ